MIGHLKVQCIVHAHVVHPSSNSALRASTALLCSMFIVSTVFTESCSMLLLMLIIQLCCVLFLENLLFVAAFGVTETNTEPFIVHDLFFNVICPIKLS